MAVPTKQTLEDAALDLVTVSNVSNADATTTVTSRLGENIKSLAKTMSELGTLTDRGAWVTSTAYAVKDLVEESGTTYICLNPHTSGTFATDLAAGEWGIWQTQLPEKYLSSYASLSAAVSSIGANEETLVLDKDDTLSGHLTIPDNITLRPMHKNIIDGAFTLTANGAILAGPIEWLSTDISLAVTSLVSEVYPEWFGADGGGLVDDYLKLSSAATSGAKTVVLTKHYGMGSDLILTDDVNLVGGGQITALTATRSIKLASRCSVVGLTLDGVRCSVAYNAEDFRVQDNTFKYTTYTPSVAAIYLITGFSTGPKRGVITGNRKLDLTNAVTCVYAEATFNTIVKDNHWDNSGHSTGYGCQLKGGSDNKITDNQFIGGIVGVVILPNRSLYRKETTRNLIKGNTVIDAAEEGISIDAAGSVPTAAVGLLTSTIDSFTSTTITLDDTFTAYLPDGMIATFMTGKLKGQSYQIPYTGGSTTVMQLDASFNGECAAGDIVTISIDTRHNIITENIVTGYGIAGVALWGAGCDTEITNNVFVSEDGNRGISISTLGGIVAPETSTELGGAYTSLVPMNPLVLGNKYTGDGTLINVNAWEFNSVDPYLLKGLTMIGNTGGSMSLEYCERIIDSGNEYTARELGVIGDWANGLPSFVKYGADTIEVSGHVTCVNDATTERILSIHLPAIFTTLVQVELVVGTVQGYATKYYEYDFMARRHNATVSVWNVTTPANRRTIDGGSVDAGKRDIDSVDLTPTLTSSATINDEAVLDLDLEAILTGTLIGASDTARISYKVILVNRLGGNIPTDSTGTNVDSFEGSQMFY